LHVKQEIFHQDVTDIQLILENNREFHQYLFVTHLSKRLHQHTQEARKSSHFSTSWLSSALKWMVAIWVPTTRRSVTGSCKQSLSFSRAGNLAEKLWLFYVDFLVEKCDPKWMLN